MMLFDDEKEPLRAAIRTKKKAVEKVRLLSKRVVITNVNTS